jgi:hypothetical protein
MRTNSSKQASWWLYYTSIKADLTLFVSAIDVTLADSKAYFDEI